MSYGIEVSNNSGLAILSDVFSSYAVVSTHKFFQTSYYSGNWVGPKLTLGQNDIVFMDTNVNAAGVFFLLRNYAPMCNLADNEARIVFSPNKWYDGIYPLETVYINVIVARPFTDMGLAPAGTGYGMEIYTDSGQVAYSSEQKQIPITNVFLTSAGEITHNLYPVYPVENGLGPYAPLSYDFPSAPFKFSNYVSLNSTFPWATWDRLISGERWPHAEFLGIIPSAYNITIRAIWTLVNYGHNTSGYNHFDFPFSRPFLVGIFKDLTWLEIDGY